MPATEPVVADRLLLVSALTIGDCVMELSETVMVRPGQRTWVQGSTYFVQSPNGQTRAIEGRVHPFSAC
ncbi:hypothetical protein [Catellatospora sichuanensis]|uniref:hypothetical protein n=1 Tax=Catellatospora sichuanensis TaxID=1969805 RepID=UPI0011842643|nr:hypothetical protein [Catellatospora sichuanensis]